jgi:hypothetical protein
MANGINSNKISSRLQQLPSSPISKLAPYVKQLEKKGISVIPLNVEKLNRAIEILCRALSLYPGRL